MRISDWSSDVCSSDLSDAGKVQDLQWHSCRRLREQGHAGNDGRAQASRCRCDPSVPDPASARSAGADGSEGKAEGLIDGRTEERRVGNECVSTWRSRWAQTKYKDTK